MLPTKASKKRETKTKTMSYKYNPSDGFDRVSDDLILFIFNKVADTRSLSRCRCVSKRFNSLVPHTENLLVKVDYIIPPDSTDFTLSQVIKTLLQSLQDFIISPKRIISAIVDSQGPFSPTEILRGFERIKRLEIELPAADLQLDKGTVLKWKAEFGKTLKTCVILGVRSIKINGVDNNNDNIIIGEETDDGGISGEMKLRVVWTISALIAASARHYMLRDVVREHEEMETMVLTDREGEGKVVMDKGDLKEFRDGLGAEEDGEGHISALGWGNRTTIPAVRMRMRHAATIDLPGGVRISGATLVIVRPSGENDDIQKNEMEDSSLADGAFDGVLGEALGVLLKRRGVLLEMNSF